MPSRPRKVSRRTVPPSRTRTRKAGSRPVYEARPVNPGGVFLPDHEQLVKLIAARGLSDKEIEQVYGIAPGTLALWRKHYPGLDKAISDGRTVADANVLYALYKNAVGYEYTEEQAVGGKTPEVLSVKRYRPGETAAQKHWLGNRIRTPEGRQEWPSRDTVEVTGPGGGKLGIEVTTRNDLIEGILGMIFSKPDNERKRKSEESSGAR